MSLLGKGTYGFVYTAATLPENSCIKVYRRRMPSMFYRQMALFNLLRGQDAREFVQTHFLIASDVARVQGGYIGYIMPLCAQDLYRHVLDNGPLIGDPFVELHDQLCEAVGYLNHNLGILHCDISPSNVIRSRENDRWLLCDFDLWRPVHAARGLAYTKSMRAPELLLECDHEASALAAEVWALGMTLDYANRGSLLSFPDSHPLEIVEDVVPRFMRHARDITREMWLRVPYLCAVVEKRPPDWHVYRDMLRVRPQDRRSMGLLDLCINTKAPMSRLSVRGGICLQTRRECLDLIIGVPGCPKTLLCAMVIVDAYLSVVGEQDYNGHHVYLALSALLLAEAFFMDNHCDVKHLRLQTSLAVLNNYVFHVAKTCEWSIPFGTSAWSQDINEGTLVEMLLRPCNVYKKFEFLF